MRERETSEVRKVLSAAPDEDDEDDADDDDDDDDGDGDDDDDVDVGGGGVGGGGDDDDGDDDNGDNDDEDELCLPQSLHSTWPSSTATSRETRNLFPDPNNRHIGSG